MAKVNAPTAGPTAAQAQTPNCSPSRAGARSTGKGPMLVAIRLLEQLCVTVSTMLRDITKANDEAGALGERRGGGGNMEGCAAWQGQRN